MSSLRRSAMPAASILLFSLTACTTDPRLPGDAIIACADNAECPGNFTCRSGRCVDPEQEIVAPDLDGALQISPNPAKSGVAVTIRFRTTEALLELPAVTLRASPVIGPLPCTKSSEVDFACTFTPDGTENGGAGGDIAVEIKLIDLVRNEAVKNSAGQLTLDFVAPVLATKAVEPAAARQASLIQVFFTASEPLFEPPSVIAKYADGGVVWRTFQPTQDTGTLNWRLTHPVGGNDPAETLHFFTSLEDRARNQSQELLVGTTTIDNKLPAIVSGDVQPRLANAGKTIVATFDVAKDVALLDGAPIVRAGNVPMVRDVAFTGAGFRYELFLDGGQPEGPQGVTIDVKDKAGNQVLGALDAVTFDFTPPRIQTGEIYYGPAAGSIFTVVDSATVGARVTVNVFANELLSGNASLVGVDGANQLSFANAPTVGAGAVFSVQIPSGLPSGDYAPRVTWTDAADNTSLPLALAKNILVRTTPPPTVVVGNDVVYLRSPWGSATAETLDSGYTIPLGPFFALAPSDSRFSTRMADSSFLLGPGGPSAAAVRVWSDESRSGLMATIIPAADRTWPLTRLVNIDAEVVFVSGFDAAGNETAATTRVPLVELVSTIRQSSFPNPNSLNETTFGETTRALVPEVTTPAVAAAHGLDGTAAQATAAPMWRLRTPNTALPAVLRGFSRTAALSYDSARGRIVAYGGQNSSTAIWEWDGEVWIDRTPQFGPQPPGRASPAMAYDAARGRTVMFGGSCPTCNDTWEWDGASWTPAALSDAGVTTPGRRQAAAMVYDPARRVVVLFGGFGSTGAGLGDTWEWDGKTWMQRTPTMSPSVRGDHKMVWDDAAARLLLYGGCPASSSTPAACNSELWSFDPMGAGTWTLLSVPGGPALRRRFAMTYDTRRSSIILFGGQGTTAYFNDTWELQNGTWTNRSSATGPLPQQSDDAELAYDEARGFTVLWDGTDGKDWFWNGTSWGLGTTPSAPAPFAKSDHEIVFEPSYGAAVCVGGQNSNGNMTTTTSEVGFWRGYGWALGFDGPPPRYDPGLAVVPDGGALLMFGGGSGSGGTGPTLNETWRYDLSSWTRLTDGGAPRDRKDMAMESDLARGKIVLFGGRSGSSSATPPYTLLSDTWEWSGGRWTAMNPATRPPPTYSHAEAFNADAGRVFIFGGRTSADAGWFAQVPTNTLWEWTGTTWLNRTPATGPMPTPRTGAVMEYDVARGKLVVFGGDLSMGSAVPYPRDTWEWDGNSWTQRPTLPLGTPTADINYATTYDPARRRILLHGGTDSRFANFVSSDLWEWDAPASLHPAVQFDVRIPAMASASLQRLEVRAFAGGNHAPFGTNDVGAQLYAWTARGKWEPLTGASNAEDLAPGQPLLPGESAKIHWVASQDSEPLYFTERDAALSFQVRPKGISGDGTRQASVAVDYIEVRVRYTAP